MASRRAARIVLAIAIAALAAWRFACVSAGPEVDTDAYAHHMIARAILADPRDLAVHWVWLPVFHYLQVPLVALGGRLCHVRYVNVVLSAVPPVVLFAFVRRTARRDEGGFPPDATALLAALFAAACPIAMQMGTTGQPEPLFALLMLGVAIAYQDRRYGAATWMLGVAAALRYEAWAAVGAIAALGLGEIAWRRRKKLAPEAEGWRVWVLVAVPIAIVVSWATLRKPFDGRWFGFLRETKQFANGVAHRSSLLEGGFSALVQDALYYPWSVARRVLGVVVFLVPFGIARTVREQGLRFVVVLLSMLGFVSLTWVMRTSLGLDRHFVVVVALYATFAAQGVATLAGALARLGRRAGVRQAPATGRYVAGAIAIGCLCALLGSLDEWMGFWTASVARGWPKRQEFGSYLRSLPDSAPIFCDDATLELLSGLDRHRFDRHWIDDPHTWELVENAAHARGVVYVATWTDKMRGHEQEGEIIYRLRERADDPSSELAVMKLVRSPDG
jgi:hypothetical protein